MVHNEASDLFELKMNGIVVEWKIRGNVFLSVHDIEWNWMIWNEKSAFQPLQINSVQFHHWQRSTRCEKWCKKTSRNISKIRSTCKEQKYTPSILISIRQQYWANSHYDENTCEIFTFYSRRRWQKKVETTWTNIYERSTIFFIFHQNLSANQKSGRIWNIGFAFATHTHRTATHQCNNNVRTCAQRHRTLWYGLRWSNLMHS